MSQFINAEAFRTLQYLQINTWREFLNLRSCLVIGIGGNCLDLSDTFEAVAFLGIDTGKAGAREE